MAAKRPRLLVSIEQGVLVDAVVHLLEAADVDDVVRTEHPIGTYDAAITVGPLPDGVRADVLIELGNSIPTRGRFVDDDGADQVIDLRDLDAVIGLLDDRCAGDSQRRDRLPLSRR